ncbi:MAG: phosphatase [Candidatus Cryptobacteroides sp.]
MKRLIDIHNHTIASGHAYSSLQEMVRAAAEAGIEYFGITDHGPSLPGAVDPMYFRNFGIIPREMYGVKLLMGCELNILDPDGTIDLDDRHCSLMDIRLAGIHKLCWRPGTKQENTEGVLNVMNNKWVNVITHPGDGTAELDFEALVRASRDTGTVLEINSSSLIPYRNKTAARPNNLEILRLCRKYDVPVIVSSDAHISFSVGDYRYALPLLEETGFPEELVLNNSPRDFFCFTGLSA